MTARCLFRRAYSTFKSKHDEQANKDLLGRLKKLSVSGGKQIVPHPKDPFKTNQRELLRNLTFEKAEKIVRYHTSDSILWNTSVLSRVFNIPENYVVGLVDYVKPMMYFSHCKRDEPEKMHETSFVIDVHRLQYDKNYLVEIQRLHFAQSDPNPELEQQEKTNVIEQLSSSELSK